MTAYEKMKAARANDRPKGSDYVEHLFTDRLEFCGDRRYAEDPAIMAGVGYLGGRAVTYLAMDKGKDFNDRVKKHFGCPMPEGYRKALRQMKLAEKFGRPVIALIDTLGAYPGADGEERGQGLAIAENLVEMMGLRVPVISVVIGEGGSGGALALGVADKVYMLENAIYSVITPDGCASIIWKDASRVREAVDCLHITADDMVKFGVAEGIFAERFDHFEQMCGKMAKQLSADLDKLCSKPADRLLNERYDRFRKIGIFREDGSVTK